MITDMILAFVICCVLALIITPYIIKFAYRIKAIDQPNERKEHTKPMPRVGGIAIFLGFFLGLAILLFVNPHCFDGTWILTYHGLIIGVLFLLIMILGLFDDLYTLKPSRKFIVQLILSSIVYFSGIQISVLSNFFSDGYFSVGIFSYPLTVLWIVGITNSLNLIDGLDGLAAGTGAIASLAMIPMALRNGDIGTTILLALLVGSLVGFLKYNFNPAKIFMGDCGSLFMGFVIAVLSIKSSTKSTSAVAILIPMLMLGLPITETLFSMFRRFLQSFHPDNVHVQGSMLSKLKVLFLPDKRHIHHMLMSKGISHKYTVILLYTICTILGLSSYVMINGDGIGQLAIFIIVGILIILSIRELEYKEISWSFNTFFTNKIKRYKDNI